MTEPPRPGEGTPGSAPDPTSPPPPASYSVPGETAAPGAVPPPPASPPPSTPYEQPGAPTSGGGYAPPTSGGGYAAPAGGEAYGQQPPGAGYPPPGGYGAAPGGYGAAPGYGAPPAGYANNEDKTWALVAHFGGALGVFIGGGFLGWVAPLIAMMTRGNQSPAVRAHAVAALNFQITWAIAMVASTVLAVITCGILFFIPMIVAIVPIVFGIIAGIKANEGQLYRYPMSASIIK